MQPEEGTLYYVIGASGSGKDSLIQYARTHLSGNRTIVFAHRYITRPADVPGENHVALTWEEFNLRRTQNLFSMVWESHNQLYGIGIEIDTWLKLGLDVVVNGSRAYLEAAVAKHPRIIPVLITASEDTLRKRLICRKRETKEQIAERLNRAKLIPEIEHPDLIIIKNDSSLPRGGHEFIRFLLDNKMKSCG